MIRNATQADIEPLKNIYNHYIRTSTVTFLHDQKTDDDVGGYIRDDDAFLVWDDGGVQGFARYFPFRGGAGYRLTVEHTILLAPDYAGKGAGRALMTALCERAKDNGKHSIFAVVSAENDAGVLFHEKVGFEPVARLPQVGNKFDRFIDAIYMQRIL